MRGRGNQSPQNRNVEETRDNFLAKSESKNLNQVSDQKLGHKHEDLARDIGMALQTPRREQGRYVGEKLNLLDLLFHSAHNSLCGAKKAKTEEAFLSKVVQHVL